MMHELRLSATLHQVVADSPAAVGGYATVTVALRDAYGNPALAARGVSVAITGATGCPQHSTHAAHTHVRPCTAAARLACVVGRQPRVRRS